MTGQRRNAICEWLQLDPGHFEAMGIEVLDEEATFGTYRLTFLDDSVSDWKFTFDEDGVCVDGYCFQDII